MICLIIGIGFGVYVMVFGGNYYDRVILKETNNKYNENEYLE